MLLSKSYGSLLVSEFDSLILMKDIGEINISEVLRVHDYSYVNVLKTWINKLTPSALAKFDIDTVISHESYKAALVAANCAIKAVDEVMAGNYKNAFCAVRPPGHHVGPYGAVASEEDPNSQSTGFCLFNNVAIAAAYAKYTYKKFIKKIAIIDFDVHHGNGTEAIVKNLNPSTIFHDFNTLPFKGTIQTYSYKPWLAEDDAKNVLFISSHAYGEDIFGKFYPASGAVSYGEDLFPAGILNIPLSKPTDSASFRMRNFYLDYNEKVFPRVIQFSPDLIFISAGFDAHGLDEINHGFVDLDEDDYRWVTEEIVKVANVCCGGKIISVLEGGYSIKGGAVSALGLSVAAHVRSLFRANKEQWAYTMYVPDAENINLKNRVQEDLKRMKRKRRRFLETMDTVNLNNFVKENLGSSKEISENNEESSDEDQDKEESQDSVQSPNNYESTESKNDLEDSQDIQDDLHLGNRTIE